MKKNNNQSGIIPIIILVIVIIVVGGFFLYKLMVKPQTALTSMPVPTQYQDAYNTSSQKVAPVQNSSDLNKTATDINSTDTTNIDTQLNSLNSISNF